MGSNYLAHRRILRTNFYVDGLLYIKLVLRADSFVLKALIKRVLIRVQVVSDANWILL